MLRMGKIFETLIKTAKASRVSFQILIIELRAL